MAGNDNYALINGPLQKLARLMRGEAEAAPNVETTTTPGSTRYDFKDPMLIEGRAPAGAPPATIFSDDRTPDDIVAEVLGTGRKKPQPAPSLFGAGGPAPARTAAPKKKPPPPAPASRRGTPVPMPPPPNGSRTPPPSGNYMPNDMQDQLFRGVPSTQRQNQTPAGWHPPMPYPGEGSGASGPGTEPTPNHSSVSYSEPDKKKDGEDDELEQLLRRAGKAYATGAQVDLSPLMALSDSWWGGKLLQGYNRPTTPQEMIERATKMGTELYNKKALDRHRKEMENIEKRKIADRWMEKATELENKIKMFEALQKVGYVPNGYKDVELAKAQLALILEKAKQAGAQTGKIEAETEVIPGNAAATNALKGAQAGKANAETGRTNAQTGNLKKGGPMNGAGAGKGAGLPKFVYPKATELQSRAPGWFTTIYNQTPVDTNPKHKRAIDAIMAEAQAVVEHAQAEKIDPWVALEAWKQKSAAEKAAARAAAKPAK